MLYFESNVLPTVELDSLEKGSQSPPGYSPKRVLMIVKRGDRRELVEVEMGFDLSTIRSRPSRIPRCHTKVASTTKKKNIDLNEEAIRRLAALYNKQSKIPRKPVASLPDKGSHQELNKACQLKPSRLPRHPNNSHPKDVPSLLCHDRLGDRMQSLHRRMDRLAGNFRLRSKELDKRLERLHQEVDDASSVYPSFFHSFRKQWLVSWGLFVVTHVCMGFMAALHSRKARGKSVKESTPGIFSDQDSLLADMASLLPAEKKEQIMMCSRTLGNTTAKNFSSADHVPKPEEPDFGPVDELWESSISTHSSTEDTFDPWRSDEMNNLVQDNVIRHVKGRRQVDEGTFSGSRKDGHRKSSITLNEAAFDQKRREERAKEDNVSPRSAHSSCNSYTDNKFAAVRPRNQMVSETGEQDTWLEAIKPEVIPAPLSRLEAESDKFPLPFLSVWHNDSDLHLNSRPTCRVSASGITQGGKKAESEFGGVLNSVQNPFFNNVRADSWGECDHSLALGMPHSRPNLLYGFEAFAETPLASSPFSQFGIEELKTKWISLNDFV